MPTLCSYETLLSTVWGVLLRSLVPCSGPLVETILLKTGFIFYTCQLFCFSLPKKGVLQGKGLFSSLFPVISRTVLAHSRCYINGGGGEIEVWGEDGQV